MNLSALFLLVYCSSFWCHSSAKNIVKRKSIGYGTDAAPPIRKPTVVAGKYPKLQSQAQDTFSQKNMDRLNKLILELKASQAGVNDNVPIPSTAPTKPPTLSPDYKDSMERIQSMLKSLQSQLNGMKLAHQSSAGTGIQKSQDLSGQLGRPSEKIGVTKRPATRTTKTTTRSTPGTPTSGPYMGFSPTSPTPTLPQTSTSAVTKSPLEGGTSHVVGSRQVSENKPLYPALKLYIAQSFIRAFDILKTALLKIDKDAEQGFQKLYNLETDHYNAANGDINANGDKIDRLQKYVSEELNVIKKMIKARPVADQSALNRNTRNVLNNLLNVTNTILNITRAINDRTERITEIKEKELQMTMLNKGQRPPHRPGSSHRHHNPDKHIPAHPNKQIRPKQTLPKRLLQKALNLQPQHALSNDGPPQSVPNGVMAKDAMSPPAGVMNKPMAIAPHTVNKAKPNPTTTKREMDRARLGRTLISENDDDFNADIIKLLEDYVDEQ